jgi:hypothetical protein
MTIDEMSANKMPLDKMSSDEMSSDEMYSDKMPLDEMTLDKMTNVCRHDANRWNAFLQNAALLFSIIALHFISRTVISTESTFLMGYFVGGPTEVNVTKLFAPARQAPGSGQVS